MAKKIAGVVKLQITAGKATPSPPVGPALGQYGINIMEFCRAYNEKTSDKEGTIIPAEVTIYTDRTFSFICKTPPASVLIKEAAGIEKGSAQPNKVKVGKIPRKKIEDIAKIKMPDLQANDLSSAVKMIEGTARSLGIEIVESLELKVES